MATEDHLLLLSPPNERRGEHWVFEPLEVERIYCIVMLALLFKFCQLNPLPTYVNASNDSLLDLNLWYKHTDCRVGGVALNIYNNYMLLDVIVCPPTVQNESWRIFSELTGRDEGFWYEKTHKCIFGHIIVMTIDNRLIQAGGRTCVLGNTAHWSSYLILCCLKSINNYF